jgi:hypothetical protein
VIYLSRLNGETNLAIYGRVIPKLKARRTRLVPEATGLALGLDDLKGALV